MALIFIENTVCMLLVVQLVVKWLDNFKVRSHISLTILTQYVRSYKYPSYTCGYRTPSISFDIRQTGLKTFDCLEFWVHSVDNFKIPKMRHSIAIITPNKTR